MQRHVHDLAIGEIRLEEIPAEEVAAREIERAEGLKALQKEQAYEVLGESLRASVQKLVGVHYSTLTASQVRDLLTWLLYQRQLLDADGNIHLETT